MRLKPAGYRYGQKNFVVISGINILIEGRTLIYVFQSTLKYILLENYFSGDMSKARMWPSWLLTPCAQDIGICTAPVCTSVFAWVYMSCKVRRSVPGPVIVQNPKRGKKPPKLPAEKLKSGHDVAAPNRQNNKIYKYNNKIKEFFKNTIQCPRLPDTKFRSHLQCWNFRQYSFLTQVWLPLRHHVPINYIDTKAKCRHLK